MNREIIISILTHNKIEYTQKCLEKLFENTILPYHRVVVTDNNSTDETKKWLKNLGNRIRLIENSENMAFAKAHNNVMRQYPQHDIVLMNNDIEVPRDWLRILQERVYSLSCAAVSPAIQTQNGLDLGAKLDGQAKGHSIIDNEKIEPDWITGSCMYICRNAIDRLGMLDETFNFYYEDVDYCTRMKILGMKFKCIKDVVIIHYNSVSSTPIEKRNMLEASRLQYIKKYSGKKMTDVILSLNWNTSDLIIQMIESAFKNSRNKIDVIIVDNGSELNEIDKLDNYIRNKNIELKRIDENIGFAAGNNAGLELMNNCNNVFFINSDIIIEEFDWDEKFKQQFSHIDIGVAGCAYHPLKWKKDGHFSIQEKTSSAIESESVQGAFFSVPFRVLKEIKEKDGFWFDENFKFAHYEETDLCLRIMKMGYKCIWFPLKHQHLHNQSSTKKNGYKLSTEIQNINDFKKNSERNRNYLISKHKKFFESRT